MPNTTIRRLADRSVTDRAAIDAILDCGLVAHVGVIVDDAPVVIPLMYARDGDRIFVHGSVLAGLLGRVASGVPVCLTVTHVDGYVLARSAFHSSMNYRSVVVQGTARRIDDRDEKQHAFDVLVDRLMPGVRAGLRPVSPGEFESTVVAAIPLDDVSAKVRTGGPKEPPEDVNPAVWAGVVPLRLHAGAPLPDASVAPGVACPLEVAATA